MAPNRSSSVPTLTTPDLAVAGSHMHQGIEVPAGNIHDAYLEPLPQPFYLRRIDTEAGGRAEIFSAAYHRPRIVLRRRSTMS